MHSHLAQALAAFLLITWPCFVCGFLILRDNAKKA